ncbi:MAG: ABC transporter permease [Acidobacteria bacterium]|nr:ABC transporter permease [Acidobacteriota bacterium]
MFTADTVQVAWDALRANRVKAFLTMLGVVIGSACIVLVVTVALTGKRYILQQIEGVGANIVYAQLVREGPTRATASDELTMADIEAVKRSIPQAAEAAGTREIPMTVVVEGAEHPVNLVGVTLGFQRIRNLVLLRGRFLDSDDMMMRSKSGVITAELGELLFPKEDPIGKSVRLGELSFTVIGVFRERVSTFGNSEIQRETVIIPYTVMKNYVEQDFIRVLYVQASHPDEVASVTHQVEDVLKSRHRSGAVFEVKNLRALLETANSISNALTVVLLLVALIALTISGIGIMNIMLVTVSQRTKEIGIRKAIGAPKREILYQFLLEAVIISGAGALAGILLAVSIPAAIKPFLPNNIRVPISGVSITVSFFVSVLTGVLFGYLPANRAAALQPTESLRYE